MNNIPIDYEHRCAEHEHDILSLLLLLGAFLKPPAPQVVTGCGWATDIKALNLSVKYRIDLAAFHAVRQR
jgi:hypothetical protein